MARVGIVVPVHNAAEFLNETIESIRAQTLTDWQCVLVDDGSTDASGQLCDAAARLDGRFVAIHRPTGGISAARNAGFRVLGDCEMVSFCDHDDLWEPELLETLAAAASDPGVIGAHCLAETVNREGNPIPGFAEYMRNRTVPGTRRFVRVAADQPTTLPAALFVNRVYPPGVLLVSADAYAKAGPWDSRFALVQDWDMLIKLLQQGPIAFVDRVLVGYRRHDSNTGRNSRHNILETRALHVAAFDRLAATTGRPTLRRWWRQWERHKIAEAVAELPSPRALARIGLHGWRLARGWPSEGRFG